MADKKRILVVEDEADLRKVLVSTLQPLYEVEAVPLGNTALEVLEARIPALVILDVHLPQLNGLEVCERMRQNAKTRMIPVLFLSGQLNDWTMQRAKRAGGDDFMSKPFDVKELLERVARLVRA